MSSNETNNNEKFAAAFEQLPEGVKDRLSFKNTESREDWARRQASKRQAAEPVAAPAVDDPTFAIRRKQANLCEAVMLRVVELETAGNAMLESAKKLRAAVMANT